MNKIIYFIFFFILTNCGMCQTDSEKFFQHGNESVFIKRGVDISEEKVIAITDTIINILKNRNDLPSFIKKCSAYGLPMWDNSILVNYHGLQSVLYVPIIPKDKSKDIDAIWYFLIDNNSIFHYILKRNPENKDIESLWMYDYFTTHILKRTPSSRLMFEEQDPIPTQYVTCYKLINGKKTELGTHYWEEGGDEGLGKYDVDYPEHRKELIGPFLYWKNEY